MRKNEHTELVVQGGRFKGKIFFMEDDIKKMYPAPLNDLIDIAIRGNWAAKNAIEIDKYKYNDAPFYYGKIEGLGYIISHKDLYGNN